MERLEVAAERTAQATPDAVWALMSDATRCVGRIRRRRCLEMGVGYVAHVGHAEALAMQRRHGAFGDRLDRDQRGAFYPVFDAGNLKNSLGGPTLAGAWVTHFAIGIGVLFGVALPFALLKSHTLPSGNDHAAAGVDGPDGAESWPPSD